MACIVSGNEIILTGTVGGGGFWWDEDCFSHADVITALAQVGRDADITVRVNSGGGVATEGAAIHAAFAQHKGKVGMVVEGWAASAASLFIMAGTTVTMKPGALLMIHDPSSGVWGPASEHRRCADALDVMANTFAQVYADRTGKTVEEMRAVMRAETWLGPAEAVAQGFADAAAEASNDNTEIEPVAFSGIGAYMRAPERITALAKANGWGTTRANLPGMASAMKAVISPTRLAIAGLTAFAAVMGAGIIRATSLNAELRKLAATQAAYNNTTMTAPQAQAAAHAMADNSPWFSRSDADAAIAELTKFRTLSAQTLRDIQATAADFAHATGKDLADGAADLAQAFAKGYGASAAVFMTWPCGCTHFRTISVTKLPWSIPWTISARGEPG